MKPVIGLVEYRHLGVTPAGLKRLRKAVTAALEEGRPVVSASGLSAALAVEWCREHNVGYTLEGGPDGYAVLTPGEHYRRTLPANTTGEHY